MKNQREETNGVRRGTEPGAVATGSAGRTRTAPATGRVRYRFRTSNYAALLTVIFFLWGSARAQEPHAFPLYEQCVQLSTNNDRATALLADLKSKEASKRKAAAAQLAKTCDSRASEPLTVALKDEDATVRIAAVEALGQLGDRETIEPLIDALGDQDWRVRFALARTLAAFQVYRSNNATLNLLSNPGEQKVTDAGDLRARCQGILMVNQLRDVRFSRKGIGFLFVFLNLPDPELQRIADQAALELKNTRNGYHELIGILKQHSYPEFRLRAAYYLGKFKDEHARPALAEASIGDRDARVQAAAKAALEELKN